MGDTSGGFFRQTIQSGAGGAFIFDVASGMAGITLSVSAGNITNIIGIPVSDPLLISGAIGGERVQKTGAGTLILGSAHNTFTDMLVSGGTLSGNTDSLASDMVLSNNASVVLNQVELGVFGRAISGEGSLTKAGGGTLTLTAPQLYHGATAIEDGILQLRWSGGLNGLRIMPIGDSITEGAGGSNAGYRGPLYTLLTTAGIQFQFVGSHNSTPGSLPAAPVDQTYHSGYGGWTIGGILGGLNSGWLNANPDITTLLIGTNNRGGNVPNAIAELSQLIDKVHTDKPNTLLTVAQITPIPGQEAWVADFNANLVALVNVRLAAGYNLLLVDLNTNYSPGTLPDNLHPNDTALTIDLGGVLNLNGGDQHLASLADGAGGGGRITNSNVAALSILTLSPTAGRPSFSGRIRLVKAGDGTQVLSGRNTYAGGTTVSNGVLLVNNAAGSGTGSGVVVIRSGATLGGTGRVGGSTTIENGGALAPGDGIGTFTLSGDLDLQAGSVLRMDVSGPSCDMLLVAGNLTLGGTRTGTFTNIVDLPAGYDLSYEPQAVVLKSAVAPPPVLSTNAITFAEGVSSFYLDTTAGFKYRLDYKDSLMATSWLPVVSGPMFSPPDGWSAISTGAPLNFMDTNAVSHPQRFYRFKAATP